MVAGGGEEKEVTNTIKQWWWLSSEKLWVLEYLVLLGAGRESDH